VKNGAGQLTLEWCFARNGKGEVRTEVVSFSLDSPGTLVLEGGYYDYEIEGQQRAVEAVELPTQNDSPFLIATRSSCHSVTIVLSMEVSRGGAWRKLRRGQEVEGPRTSVRIARERSLDHRWWSTEAGVETV